MVPSLRVEDRLDGATNLRSWKTRILLVLDEIQNYVKENVSKLESAEEKAKNNKNQEKAKRILIDSITVHLIPHVAELKFANEMYDALVGLFEVKNISVKLALRHQLHWVMMFRLDLVATYVMSLPVERST